jgi:two-component system KDP operon response regulator KdpE
MKTILIIDDEFFLRATLAAILRRAGYSTQEAGNAQTALQMLSGRRFDLVFLDLQMPERDGLDLMPEILSLAPGVPVLILTANSTSEKTLKAQRLGACDILLKPVDPCQIISRVSDLLKENGPAVTQTPARFIEIGPYSLDLELRQVCLNDQVVPLPNCTFAYLASLLRHAPDPASFEALVEEAQGCKLDKIAAQDLARLHIFQLRQALEEDPLQPVYILSVPGIGYRLVLPGS